MVHRVESSAVEIYWDLPPVNVLEYCCLLHLLLVVPDYVYLGNEFGVAVGLGIPLEVFLKDCEVPSPGVGDCKKTETE